MCKYYLKISLKDNIDYKNINYNLSFIFKCLKLKYPA